LLFTLFFFSDKKIKAHNSDQKVYITAFNKIAYTDTFVTVGEPILYQDGNQAITNPILIVEVASKSTEHKDRTTKFRMYQSLPTFQEYVIVNQDMPIVEVFYKLEDNKWQMTSYVGLDKVVKFETIDAELKMSDIYKETINLQDPQIFIDFLEEEA
jgi:Uma2 family endonuclease